MADITRVLFRTHNGTVTAIFPDDKEGVHLFGCYAHVGQHGACDKEWALSGTRTRKARYQDLKTELEAAPYNYRFEVLADWPLEARA